MSLPSLEFEPADDNCGFDRFWVDPVLLDSFILFLKDNEISHQFPESGLNGSSPLRLVELTSNLPPEEGNRLILNFKSSAE